MSNVPTNLIPTRITGLPDYTGTSTLGYFAYALEGRTYKVQFSQLAAVGAVPSTRVIGTGNGLEGGGDLSQDRVISIIPHGVGYSQLDFTGVTAGTYGSADTVPSLTIDATGRVTAAANTPIVLSNYVPSSRTVTAGAGLTGGGQLNNNITIALNPSNATPQSLGAASAGTGTQAARDDHVHPAVDLTDTSETQGVLPLGRGGTGVALSPVVGAVIYADNDSLNQTVAGNAGQILKSAGGLGAPYWDDLLAGGTVTSVSVVTANGFAGTVANPTSTPAITLTTTVTGLVKANGSALSAAVAGTDYIAPGAITTSGLTMATARLLGRTTASSGAVEEITVGTGLSLSGGSLTNSAPDQVVSLTGGTAISISGTYPAFTVTNTAPDQIVSLTGAGTTVVTGTYPSFTITSNDAFVGTVTSVSGTGTVSGLTLTGTVTSSGSLTLGGTLAVLPSNFASQTANTVLAAPNGSAGVPTFRAIVAADIPTLNQNTTGTASNVTGIVAVANGGTGASVAGTARTNLGAAASGANTDITSIALTTGTISATPTSGTDIVNKLYADSIASGINFHQSVRLATAAALPANTYNNGASGVGATLTANANGALSVDGVAVVAGNRILVKNEVTQANNGVYTVTQVGSAGAPYILTRATDFDSSGAGVDQIDAGDFFLVTSGSTQSNTSWVQQTPLPITVGTTALVFTQFAAPVLYSAGTGLTLAGTVFSITNTGVSASTYGSASSVPVLAVNAQGQITSASSTSIAIAASQITSGTLGVANGGTGQSSYTNGQLLIGNSTGNTLAKATLTAGTNISITNGAGSITINATDQFTGTVTSVAASGGTTGLTFSGSPITTSGTLTLGGTLGVANGGTGATTLTGYVKGNGTSAFTASATIPASDISSGAALTKTDDTNVTLTLGGSPSTALLAATSLTLGWTGQLGVTRGGTGTGTAFTAGSIVFAGTSGVYSQKNANLFWDNSNNRLGIGTTSPSYAVEVAGDLRLAGGGDLRLGSATGTTGTAGDSSIFSDVNDMYFNTGNATRVYIANGGNVGIGNTGPGYRLDVASADTTAGLGYAVRIRGNATAAGGALQFTDSGVTAQWGFLAATATAVTLDATNASILAFRTNGSERMRVDSSGNVGIGTSSPGFKLDVSGDAHTSGSVFTGSNTDGWGRFVNSGGALYFQAGSLNSGGATAQPFIFTNMYGGSERMRIDSSGNVGIGTSAPKSRLQATAGAQKNAPALGNATNAPFYLSNNDTGYGLVIGNNAADGHVWLQAQRTDGSAVAYNMSLNEAGGKVLVGTSSDIDGSSFQIDAATGGNAVYVTRFTNSSTSTSAYNVSRWTQGASGSAIGYVGTGGSAVGAAFFQNRFVVGTQNNTALCFATNDTFRGMIDGGGQFWWGSQSTIDTVSYAPFQITNALAINTNTTSGTTAVSFFNGQGSGVRVGYIGTSGSSTSYNTSSDERLKENIVDAADAGALIDAIQVRQFDWKINGDHQRYGMIAQELDLVFPEAVGHGPTEEDMLAVDYSKLVPMLVKEVQSLRARLALLEGK